MRCTQLILLVLVSGCESIGPECPGPCGLGELCLDGECRLLCNTFSECPAEHACADGVCLPGIACEETECSTPCVNGFCFDPCVGDECSGGIEPECEVDTDCPSATELPCVASVRCVDRVCRTEAATGDVCRAASCSDGVLQDTRVCATDASCPDSGAHSCGGYDCVDASHCRDTCTTDSHCIASHRCEQGACEPRPGVEDALLVFSDCETGSASAGYHLGVSNETIARTIQIENVGALPTTALTVHLSGDSPFRALAGQDTCTGHTLAAGQTCAFGVEFLAGEEDQVAGTYHASLEVTATAGGTTACHLDATAIYTYVPSGVSSSACEDIPGRLGTGCARKGLSSSNASCEDYATSQQAQYRFGADDSCGPGWKSVLELECWRGDESTGRACTRPIDCSEPCVPNSRGAGKETYTTPCDRLYHWVECD